MIWPIVGEAAQGEHPLNPPIIPVFIGFFYHPFEELLYVFLGCSYGEGCGNDYSRLKIASDQFLNRFNRAIFYYES